LLVGLAHLGQIDEHHVAQCVLRVRGDADYGGLRVAGVDPLVLARKLDVHGNGS